MVNGIREYGRALGLLAALEDAQLAMLSAWLVAQADALPTWTPGDEFEAARKQALAAAGGP